VKAVKLVHYLELEMDESAAVNSVSTLVDCLGYSMDINWDLLLVY